MDVSCPSCAARYDLDSLAHHGAGAGSRTLQLTCPACETVWLVPNSTAGQGRASSVPPPAVERAHAAVRRRNHQDRDLFAPPPSDFGLNKPTTYPPPAGRTPSSVSPGGYGARNENSVLFTLDSLRNSAAPPPVTSAEGRGAKHDEDSGIVDLQSLSMAPPSVAAVPNMFGSDAPLPTFSAEIDALGDPSATSKRGPFGRFSRKQLGIAAAGLVGLLGVVLALTLAFRGESPDMTQATSALAATGASAEQAAAPTQAPPPVAPTPVAAVAAASPEPTTEAEPEAPEEAAPKSGKHKAKRHGRGGGHHASPKKKAHASPAKAAAPKAHAAKGADPCGCHGNFECAMRCAAKGK